MATRTWTYGLTANIVVLGVVSLLTDVSSEMILPILPFFLISVLSANAFIVGLVEGLADSAVAFMKVVSGRWSDVAGSRRGFVAAGHRVSSACVFLGREPSRVASRPPRFRASLRSIPRSLVLFIGIASVFSFADFSFVFLLLRVTDVGWSTFLAILLYILFNIVYAVHALPAGILSDHVGRKPVILVGYGFFIAMAVLIAGLPSAVAGGPPLAPTPALLAV